MLLAVFLKQDEKYNDQCLIIKKQEMCSFTEFRRQDSQKFENHIIKKCSRIHQAWKEHF